jgi:diguanylate cyclase (GGDEF)-like protein
VRQSRAEFTERLENEYERFVRERVPLAVLWITVDQARELRKTHGARACETMLETVERTLANGLAPGEQLGRWSDDEFLVFSHEKSAKAIDAHAQMLARLAGAADFRWWGDRISLTVSVGASMAEPGETLADFLERAQTAMQNSTQSSGNHAGRQPCSPS